MCEITECTEREVVVCYMTMTQCVVLSVWRHASLHREMCLNVWTKCTSRHGRFVIHIVSCVSGEWDRCVNMCVWVCLCVWEREREREKEREREEREREMCSCPCIILYRGASMCVYLCTWMYPPVWVCEYVCIVYVCANNAVPIIFHLIWFGLSLYHPQYNCNLTPTIWLKN